MLKKIPTIISPELLKVLDEMGHGETLFLCDGNCGVSNFGRTYLRLDEVGIPELSEAILNLLSAGQ